MELYGALQSSCDLKNQWQFGFLNTAAHARCQRFKRTVHGRVTHRPGCRPDERKAWRAMPAVLYGR